MAARGDQRDLNRGDVPLHSGFSLNNTGEKRTIYKERRGRAVVGTTTKYHVSPLNYGVRYSKVQQKLDNYLKKINSLKMEGSFKRWGHRTCKKEQKRSYYMLTKITQQEVINGIRASSMGDSEKVLLKFFIKNDESSLSRHIFLTQGLQEHLQSCLENVNIRNRLKRSLFYLIDQCPVIYESRSVDHVDMVVCCDYYPSLINEYVGTYARAHQNEHVFRIDKIEVRKAISSEVVVSLSDVLEETFTDTDLKYQPLLSFRSDSWALTSFEDCRALTLNLSNHAVLQHHRTRLGQPIFSVAIISGLDMLYEYLDKEELEALPCCENEIHFQYETYHYKHLVNINIYFKNLNN